MPIKVLAIDDDPAMTELLNLLLMTQGLEVKTANTGEEGIKIIREYEPDIVILDLMMPGMNGWQVCSEARRFSNVPILILSALDNPANVTRALDSGADDYLVKPVPSGSLVAHIHKITRRVHVQSKGILPEAVAASV